MMVSILISMLGIGLLGAVAMVVRRHFLDSHAAADEDHDLDQLEDVFQAIESMQEGRPTGGPIDEDSFPGD